MDDLIHRRNSYPQIENLQNSSVYDPSAIDLPEITRGNSDRLVPRITFDHSDRGVDPKNSEPIRYSTSDFNKDLDDIQSNIDEFRMSSWSKRLTIDQGPTGQNIKPRRFRMQDRKDL